MAFLDKFFPDFLTALAIIVAGLVLAHITTWVLRRAISKFTNTNYKAKQRGLGAFFSHLVYWVIIVTATYQGLLQLNIKFITEWMNAAAAFTPKLIVSFVIIFVGYLISRVVRSMLIEVSPSPLTRITADFTALFILAVTILIGIDHIDINLTLLNNLFIIAFTLILASVFGVLFLSSYQLVREMLHARFVADTYVIGQHISVNGYEGTIESIKKTSVHLVHDAKTIVLPARVLLENPVVVITDIEGE